MESPLRIALLVDPLTLSTKGGEHAPELARELLGLGHHVRGFGAPPGAIPRSSDDGEVGSAPVGLAGFEPDVVLAYESLSPTAWLGARTARRTGAALVLVEVGADPSQIRLHERLLQGIGARLWSGRVRQTARAVIALDPVARDRAVREGFGEDLVEVVPRGVDLQEFRPGLTSGIVARQRILGRVLLYAGRLEVDRGVETLIDAFAHTVGQRGDWSLVLAGEGGARRRFETQCARLGVSDRVHWIGRPRREELPGLLGASTLLAVPALDTGVLGKQIPRAMAAGLPVVVSDLPRFAHLVEDDGPGLRVRPGDARAWREALQRAASSPEARRRWGATGRRIAEESLAWPRISERVEAILREALERARADETARGEEGEEAGEDGRPDDADVGGLDVRRGA